MRILRIAAFYILVSAVTAWGTMAVYYSCGTGLGVKFGAAIFPLASAGALLFMRPKKRLLILAGLFIIVLLIWNSNAPSNDRNWQPDVAHLPHATIDENTINIRNIRNIDYRSEEDFTVRYYDKSFDLDKLRSIDIFLSDWGLKAIVHTLVSFGFEDGSYVCISIETRKEVGEAYSNIKGLFRQYELIYVVGDERDIVRLRTNYRQGETVYLYRVQGMDQETARQIFLDYLKYVNDLATTPEWYNALTSNCTTQIRGHTRAYAKRVFWDWRILVNGFVDEMAYELGTIDNSMPFEVLKSKSIINSRALAADQDPDFSKRIRVGLPGMDYRMSD